MANHRRPKLRRRVSRHHVEAIRRRMTLRRMTVRKLASRAGMSASFLYDVLRGKFVSTCSLGQLLTAVGLDAAVTGRLLWQEARAVEAVMTLTERNDADGMTAAVAALDAIVASGNGGDAGASGRVVASGVGR